MNKNLKVCLFGGGRGAASIAKALDQHSQVDLSILLNAYDDGLSTGRIRMFIPGMLGPSDVRKNISNLMPKEYSSQALSELLEYRLPVGSSTDFGRSCVRIFAECDPVSKGLSNKLNPALWKLFLQLTISQVAQLSRWASFFLEYELQQAKNGIFFDYGDASMGNIFFGGCYLSVANSFNAATENFSNFCGLKSKVLNITNGDNYVLVALKESGEFMHDEAAIVSPQDSIPISEIFLLKNYLSDAQMLTLSRLSLAEKKIYLKELECFPLPDECALEELRTADLIIYGPGTQYSSLLPSYLTKGVSEAIANNTRAVKIFVSNIQHDHDIPNASVEDLVDGLLFYMNSKGVMVRDKNSYITNLFVQSENSSKLNSENLSQKYLPINSEYREISLSVIDWEDARGKHSGGRIVDEVLKIAKQLIDVRLQPFRHKVSIVVPVLNEISTLDLVLEELKSLDLACLGMGKELIFVDGGSTDGSLERLYSEEFIELYSVPPGDSGRGAAIRCGIKNAKGNVIVVFPADHEYSVGDIVKVASPIISNDFQFVLGSRLIRCDDIGDTLKLIYGDKYIRRTVSWAGGILLSLSSLILYKRYVGDPLTSLKAIDADHLNRMELSCNGIDLETELIAKSRRLGQYILEVPVDYNPRRFISGKKSGIILGLGALYALFKFRCWIPSRK